MKKIATMDAVGLELCHDISRIVKDVEKGVAFRKGYTVQQQDIDTLHSLGKYHLFVWEQKNDMIHEEDAADILRDICQNTNMGSLPVREGKIEIKAQIDGLFRVDAEKLNAINVLGQICISTRHSNIPVKNGESLAAVRVVPLVIAQEKMNLAKELAGNRPLMELLPYKLSKAGIVTTGTEIARGLIKDTFSPVIVNKLKKYGISVIGHEIVGDIKEDITRSILKLRDCGAQLILCTGGMSVDPDDATPGAIADSGATIVSYGSPVLPGNMLLSAYLGDIPVLGLPACVMYERRTVFDVVLPRIAACTRLEEKDFAAMGVGGLCLKCDSCHYPNCGFGKSC